MKTLTAFKPKLSVPPVLDRYAADARRYWLLLAPRERRLLALAGAVAGAALVFLVLVEPAWTRYSRLQQQLPLLRTQAARVDALAIEAGSLQRVASGRMTADETRRALEQSLDAAGLAGTVEPAAETGAEALRVSIDQVSAAGLMQWLASVPGLVRLQLTEAELERPADADGRRQPGKVSGTLLFVPPENGADR